MLEAVESRIGSPCELLLTDDLMLIADSMEGLADKFKKWRDGMDLLKDLTVNVKKSNDKR